MIQELEKRHAMEKKQLLQRLDEEEEALSTALPEARRLMAQASQKLSSSFVEARAYCKAEAAHLAQKTLRTIAKREGAGLPVGDDQSKIPPGSPKGGNNNYYTSNTPNIRTRYCTVTKHLWRCKRGTIFCRLRAIQRFHHTKMFQKCFWEFTC